MTARELLEVKTELQHGRVWALLKELYLGEKRRLELLEDAAVIIPQDLATSNLRERALARVVVFKELETSFPADIDELIKQAQEKERQQ